MMRYANIDLTQKESVLYGLFCDTCDISHPEHFIRRQLLDFAEGLQMQITINGNAISTDKGKTVLEVCKGAGINIPPLHHQNVLTNILTSSHKDPVTGTPEYKFSAVKIEKTDLR
jgi:predicted molibdopterin-dependent oxidoreductase YjgC